MIRVCYYKGCGVVYGEKEPCLIKGQHMGYAKSPENLLKEIKA